MSNDGMNLRVQFKELPNDIAVALRSPNLGDQIKELHGISDALAKTITLEKRISTKVIMLLRMATTKLDATRGVSKTWIEEVGISNPMPLQIKKLPVDLATLINSKATGSELLKAQCIDKLTAGILDKEQSRNAKIIFLIRMVIYGGEHAEPDKCHSRPAKQIVERVNGESGSSNSQANPPLYERSPPPEPTIATEGSGDIFEFLQ